MGHNPIKWQNFNFEKQKRSFSLIIVFIKCSKEKKIKIKKQKINNYSRPNTLIDIKHDFVFQILIFREREKMTTLL